MHLPADLSTARTSRPTAQLANPYNPLLFGKQSILESPQQSLSSLFHSGRSARSGCEVSLNSACCLERHARGLGLLWATDAPLAP
jgi:hypothetical protein